MSIVIEQASQLVKASAAFHSHADMETINLIEAKVERIVNWENLKGPIHLDFKYEVKAANVTESMAEIQTAFRFLANDSSSQVTQALLVECTFQANYSLVPGYKPSDSEIEAFQAGNAVFNAWPFFREFVQTSITRMGLPIPPVPFLRLVPVQPEQSPIQKANKSTYAARTKAPVKTKKKA